MAQGTPSAADASESNGPETDDAGTQPGVVGRYAEELLAALMIVAGAFLVVYFLDPITKFAGVGLIVLALVTVFADWRFS